jgi:hypothetical protein
VHEPRFDAWTRMFADLRSRRVVARGMIGAAALLLAGRNVPGLLPATSGSVLANRAGPMASAWEPMRHWSAPGMGSITTAN